MDLMEGIRIAELELSRRNSATSVDSGGRRAFPTNCGGCERKSRSACFRCMDEYYSHMHDSRGGRLRMAGKRRE